MTRPRARPGPDTAEGTAPTAAPRSGHRWSPEWQAALPDLAAGALLAGGMPPRTAWYLAPAGSAVFTWALTGLQWRQRLVVGVGAGLAFFLPTLSWLTGFYPAGFAALVLLEAALLAAAMLLVDPRAGRCWTVPVALVALEAVRARFPFGGFPLPGIALGQLDGPFAAAAPSGAPCS